MKVPELISEPLFVGSNSVLETIGWWLYAHTWSLFIVQVWGCWAWYNSKPLLINDSFFSYGWPLSCGFIIWCCVCFIRGHGMAVG